MPVRANDRIPRTKLLTPSPGNWELQRPRLLDHLNHGRGAPLSLICGMAGSGKTTLARQWSSSHDFSAWLALDDDDDELSRFVHLLVAAARTVYPAFGRATLADLTVGESMDPEDLAASFCDDFVDSGITLTIVLDDFHVIAEPSIFDFLEWLFQYPPPNLHLCLVGRTEPPLPLASYRARFDLVEVRLAHLLLNLEETERFLFDVSGTPISPDALLQLHEQTEGWITGLHLTALAMRDSQFSSVTNTMFHQGLTNSMEYLADQIVARQPDNLQRQLLMLAIPEQISAELGWHLLESGDRSVDAEALLKSLEANGFFLTSLGNDHLWYRFHPLFRDTLLELTERRHGAGQIEQGHRRAADWFASKRDIDRAIRHYLAAGDPERAAALVEQDAQRALATDDWQRLEWWLKELPPETRDRRIDLVLAQTWIDQMRGAYRKLPGGVRRARTLLTVAGDALPAGNRAIYEAEADLLESFDLSPEDSWDRLVHVGRRGRELLRGRNRAIIHIAAYFETLAHIGQNDWEAAFAFLERMSQDDRGHSDELSVSRDLWARTYLGIAKLWHGDLDVALDLAHQIHALALEHGQFRLVAQANYLMGAVHYERNDLEQTLELAGESFHEPSIGILFRSEASHLLARAAMRLGRCDLATATLDRITDILLAVDFLGRSEWMRAARAELAAARGDWHAADTWSVTSPRGANGPSLVNITIPPLIRARILMTADPNDARRLEIAGQELDLLDERLSRQRVQRVWIGVGTLRAAWLDLNGDESGAMNLLSETIDDAKGHVRSFLDNGVLFDRVFEKLIARDGANGHRRVLLEAMRSEPPRSVADTLVLSLPRPERLDPRPASNLVGSLSDREREILGYLASRLTNKEIADALDISPLTVKRHTINAYAKLGVRGRREAVRVAFPES